MEQSLRESAIDRLDTFLTLIGCASADLRRFDGAQLILGGTDADWIANDPISCLGLTPADVNNHWKVSMIGDRTRVGDAITLYRSETLHWSKWSHFAKAFPNVDLESLDALVKYESLGVRMDGMVTPSTWVYLPVRHNKLTIMDPNAVFIAEDQLLSFNRDRVIPRVVDMQIGHAFMEPGLWLAKVRIQDDAPSIAFATDPTGIKELWKFRDIPSGRARRSAMLHWVSDHWRKTRVDPDVETYVRQHLRGNRELRCSGLSVVIQESADDRIAAMRAAFDRNRMRTAKADRRRRPTKGTK